MNQEKSLESWLRFLKRQAILLGVLMAFGFFIGEGPMGSLGGALIWFLMLTYFLPYEIAASRKHPSKWAIGALNLFLGWSFFGWVAALVWALATNPVIK